MTQRSEQMQQIVGGSGVLIGLANVAAPHASGRFWDVAPDSAPVVPHLIRIYGINLVTLGVLALRADGDQRQPVLQLAAATAATTAGAGLLAGATGRLGRRGAAMAVAAAGGLAGLAWSAARH